VRIEHDAAGHVSAVIYADAKGAIHRQRAHRVVLAANAIETPRLLLLSESNRHPRGLANGSGQVGRNYMRHLAALTYAAMPQPVNMHRGVVTPGTVFDEARHDPGRGFAGGYLMEAASMAPVSLALLLDPGGWGRDYAAFFERYDHLAGMLMNGEEPPGRRQPDHARRKDQGRAGPSSGAGPCRRASAERSDARPFQRPLRRPLPGGRRHRRPSRPSAIRSPQHGHGADGSRYQRTRWSMPTSAPMRCRGCTLPMAASSPTSTSVDPTLTIVALALRLADHLAARA